MAHFAKLDDNNIVLAVHALGNKVTENSESVEDENIGIAYLTKIHQHSNWKQTSYNTTGGVHRLGGTPLRKNYAGKGYTYDEGRDAFIPPKPFNSWILDEDTCLWESLVAYPDDGKRYTWNEDNQSWDIIE
jgi:hypothetical protein|tara:strand:+ start:1087 stop:1479 length:393 start_codon:yes stop_codon:yes gene_type:complete